jgi:putative ABC transport system permease protein
MAGRPITRGALGWRAVVRDPAATTTLAVLALLMGLGVSAAPRFVNEKSDQALMNAASEAAPAPRNLSFQQYRRIAADRSEPFGAIDEAGQELDATILGLLGEVTDPSVTMIDSPMFQMIDVPIDPSVRIDRWFTFRAVAGAEGLISLVEGSLPSPSGPAELVVGPCEDEEGPGDEEKEEEEEQEDPDPCDPVEVPVFQTAISTETSRELRLGVGDTVLLRANPDIPNNRNLPRAALDYQAILEISGIVDLTDPGDDVWQGDALLHRPTRVPVGFTDFDTFGAGLLSPEEYDRLLDLVLPSRFLYTWRFQVDYGKVDSTNVEEIRTEISRLELAHQGSDAISQPVLFTGIDQIIEAYDAERSLTVTLTSLILVGLLGLTLATGVVLSGLAARRREDTTILIRGRGAGRRELALLRLAEGILIFVPAALLGRASAGWLAQGRPGDSDLLWSVGGGLTLAVVLTLTALPTLAGDLGHLMAGTPSRRFTGRRIIGEALAVVVGIGAVGLLRRRGISADASVDPLLASVPLLVAVVAGIVLLRVLPVAFKLASLIAGRARGVIAMIGLRSLASRSLPAQLPPIVALIGVTLAVFGLIFLQTIDANQVRGSWHEVGANYRMEPFNPTGTVSPQFDLSGVAGVEAVAAGVIHDAGISETGGSRGSIQLLAVDLDDYQRVGAGTPADPALPQSLQISTPIDAGTESNPIPVLVSSRWVEGSARPGDIITLSIGHRPTVVIVQEVRDVFPGMSPARPFAVMSRGALGAVSSTIPVQPNQLYVRAPDAAAPDLAKAIEEQQPGLRFISRPSRLQTIQDRPAVEAIRAITAIVLLSAIVLAAVAVVSGFALTSRERLRDMGYLRAIGLSSRQMTRATVLEQMPPAITAVALGSLAGLLVWATVGTALDLEPVTGSALDVEPAISWAAIGLTAVVVAGTVAVATAIYSYVNREMDLANVLRRGDRT